jgi:hypothetical protein
MDTGIEPAFVNKKQIDLFNQSEVHRMELSAEKTNVTDLNGMNRNSL